MRFKPVYILLLTLPLPCLYWFAEGFDLKVDWFVFVDAIEGQKPKWYVHYSAIHIENIIKTGLIHWLCLRFGNKKTASITRVFVFFAIFRFFEYWLFWHHVPIISIIGLILFHVFYVISTDGSKNIINN